MSKAMTVLVGILTVLMGFIWLQIMISPQQMAEQLFLSPVGVEGLNTLRADIGGIFFAGWLFSLMALVWKNRLWLLAVALIMAGAALGRAIGLGMDGINVTAMGSMIVEIVLVALYLLAYKKI